MKELVSGNVPGTCRGYAVRKVKSFVGNEGHGFNAELVRDGKPVAFVIDDANGGAYSYDWYDRGAAMVDVAWTDWEGKPTVVRATPEEAALYEAIRGRTWENEFSQGSNQMEPDMFVGGLVDEHENDKRLRRVCKSKTLFRVKGDKVDEWRTIKSAFDQRVKDWIASKYGDQVEEILNERFAA